MAQVVWFKVPLTCLTNGAEIARERVDLYTSALSPVVEDIGLEVGDAIDISIEDFEDAYYTLHAPDADEPVLRILERWGCAECHLDHWIRIEFKRTSDGKCELTGAEAVPLTRDMVERSHFVSRWMDSWLEARPEPAFDAIMEVVLPAFPPDKRERVVARRREQHVGR